MCAGGAVGGYLVYSASRVTDGDLGRGLGPPSNPAAGRPRFIRPRAAHGSDYNDPAPTDDTQRVFRSDIPPTFRRAKQIRMQWLGGVFCLMSFEKASTVWC